MSEHTTPTKTGPLTELDKRGEAAAGAMKTAFVVALVLAAISTIALIVTKVKLS